MDTLYEFRISLTLKNQSVSHMVLLSHTMLTFKDLARVQAVDAWLLGSGQTIGITSIPAKSGILPEMSDSELRLWGTFCQEHAFDPDGMKNWLQPPHRRKIGFSSVLPTHVAVVCVKDTDDPARSVVVQEWATGARFFCGPEFLRFLVMTDFPVQRRKATAETVLDI